MNSLTSSTSTSALPESWVEKMFHKMLLEYGKKFTDQWGGADTGELIKHWAHQLAGYSPAEIKRGLAALDARDWPPTLPEFKKMCRPPVSEIAAYHEALTGLETRDKGEAFEWSHPAIFWAASLIRVDLMGQSYGQIKDRWASALKSQLERNEWAEIPQARVALPAPDVSPAAKANASKMLNELGVGSMSPPKGEDKRWARKILERQKRGDKTLTAYQIKEATMALGRPVEAEAA